MLGGLSILFMNNRLQIFEGHLTEICKYATAITCRPSLKCTQPLQPRSRRLLCSLPSVSPHTTSTCPVRRRTPVCLHNLATMSGAAVSLRADRPARCCFQFLGYGTSILNFPGSSIFPAMTAPVGVSLSDTSHRRTDADEHPWGVWKVRLTGTQSRGACQSWGGRQRELYSGYKFSVSQDK